MGFARPGADRGSIPLATLEGARARGQNKIYVTKVDFVGWSSGILPATDNQERTMNQQFDDQVFEREAALDKILSDIEAARKDPELLAAVTRVVKTALAIKSAIKAKYNGSGTGANIDAGVRNSGTS